MDVGNEFVIFLVTNEIWIGHELLREEICQVRILVLLLVVELLHISGICVIEW